MDSQFQSLKEEMHEMHKNYNNREGDHASKNDDTLMCERHEANYIQSEGNQNQNSHNLFSLESHHDPNDSKKSLTDLNNDVKNDLEDFKRCVRSMRIVHFKLYERDDQSKTDLEKTINKFLDGQRVANIKLDEWPKSQNVSSEQTDRANLPPTQAQTEQVNTCAGDLLILELVLDNHYETATRSRSRDIGEPAISTALGAAATGTRETTLDGGLKYSSNMG
ncbi:hypothetical protein Tco_0489803 [Tanacetum coccineum]